MTRRFTGYHMAAILAGFFAVVVSVNMLMAVLASRTFGGTVVENSYVASQRFNHWLAAARRQSAHNLDVQVSLDVARHLVVAIRPDLVSSEAAPAAVAEHPLGRAPEVPIRFILIAPGRFRSTEAMPQGRWNVRVRLSTVRGEARLLEQIR